MRVTSVFKTYLLPGFIFQSVVIAGGYELTQAVDSDTIKLVCSLHGMGKNTSRAELVPEMLCCVLGSATQSFASRERLSIAWPTPGRDPDGRSRNHRAEGFLLAPGESFEAGGTVKGAHILDLAPTVLALLELPVLPEMRGRALLDESV